MALTHYGGFPTPMNLLGFKRIKFSDPNEIIDVGNL